jgi:hypothetical protein
MENRNYLPNYSEMNDPVPSQYRSTRNRDVIKFTNPSPPGSLRPIESNKCRNHSSSSKSTCLNSAHTNKNVSVQNLTPTHSRYSMPRSTTCPNCLAAPTLKLNTCCSTASASTQVSNRLSLADERHKIRQWMLAPIIDANFTTPHAVNHLPHRPPVLRQVFNTRRTDLNDNALMLRLIRECIAEHRQFSFYD